MKLRGRNIKLHVMTDPASAHPVLLCLCGLHFALRPDQARALADQLHDAAEDIDR